MASPPGRGAQAHLDARAGQVIATDWVTVRASQTATITKAQERRISALRTILKAAKKVSCVGHTSTRRGVSARHANALTLRQARAACALVKRLAPKVTTAVVRRGKARPLVSNATAAGRTINRRIVITLA